MSFASGPTCRGSCCEGGVEGVGVGVVAPFVVVATPPTTTGVEVAVAAIEEAGVAVRVGRMRRGGLHHGGEVGVGEAHE